MTGAAASTPSLAVDERRSRWVAALVAGAFFMENLDGTVITTAIPEMARSFGARPVDLSAGISAYLLTLAVFIPISGWVADRFGPRNVFASAVALFGNLTMKPATTWLLRRFGFRQVLLVNGLLVVAGFAACALLGPGTPRAVIAAVLFACGLCRSMQFTSFNTLAFADVPRPQMSGATTLFSAVGQMTAGLGVALGALALHAGQVARGQAGERLAVGDFRIAFALMGLLAALALIDAWRLPHGAGAEVSGHRRG